MQPRIPLAFLATRAHCWLKSSIAAEDIGTERLNNNWGYTHKARSLQGSGSECAQPVGAPSSPEHFLPSSSLLGCEPSAPMALQAIAWPSTLEDFTDLTQALKHYLRSSKLRKFPLWMCCGLTWQLAARTWQPLAQLYPSLPPQ